VRPPAALERGVCAKLRDWATASEDEQKDACLFCPVRRECCAWIKAAEAGLSDRQMNVQPVYAGLTGRERALHRKGGER
jgi:hypothetical protein